MVKRRIRALAPWEKDAGRKGIEGDWKRRCMTASKEMGEGRREERRKGRGYVKPPNLKCWLRLGQADGRQKNGHR